ncbi:MAG: hypothetical protein ING40_11145 [Burkholderiales bacterium]|nr:hypothetical protein [Burkholderiales bacterium]MCA3229576.1 hypothetical protein [Burkholderiales bacterium]
MSGKAWLALLCLLAGVALASYGLAYGALLLALAGLALVMTFVYFAYAWVAGASRPMGAQARITPAADAAWSMKDQPLDNPRQDTQS